MSSNSSIYLFLYTAFSIVTTIVPQLVFIQVGLEGEYLGLQNVSLANSSIWTDEGDLPLNRSLTWYKVNCMLQLVS